MNPFLFASPRQRLLLAIASAAIGVAALLFLSPAEVLAAVDSGGGAAGGNGATQGARNFKTNGLSSVQSVGVVVFSVMAIAAIARGTLGGKQGQGLVAFAVACLGMSVSVGPEAVMTGIGGWATGLFKS